jgi:hypothetical protein
MLVAGDSPHSQVRSHCLSVTNKLSCLIHFWRTRISFVVFRSFANHLTKYVRRTSLDNIGASPSLQTSERKYSLATGYAVCLRIVSEG